jgi:polyphosphate kinase
MGKREIINRELSWIDFNRRVLEEAANPDIRVERCKYLSICTTNLDSSLWCGWPPWSGGVRGDTKNDPSGSLPVNSWTPITPSAKEQWPCRTSS